MRLALLGVAALGGPGRADDMAAAQRAVHVAVEPGWRAAVGRHVAGLRITLAPGWRTYWRVPGSTGIAPRFDWAAGGSVTAVEPVWPVPSVFRGPEGLAFGFEDGLILPLVVSMGPGDAVLEGTLSMGVCAAVCLPVQVPLSIALPEGGAPVAALTAGLEGGPRRVDAHADCSIRPSASGSILEGRMALPPLGGAEAVAFEIGDPRLWIADARVERRGGTLVARAAVLSGDGGPAAPDLGSVRITAIGADDAVELAGCAR